MITTQYEQERFDKTNPTRLYSLRCMGRSRRHRFINRHGSCNHTGPHTNCRCASTSLSYLSYYMAQRKGVYIDFGCGDSPDAAIASDAGHYAYALDLVPPSESYQPSTIYNLGRFFKGDITGNMNNFGSGFADYASCHAVISLMRPYERIDFYHNVLSILRHGGLFAFTINQLRDGWKCNTSEECRVMQEIGFRFKHKGTTPLAYKP